MITPSISVVMPVYNAEKYLAQAIESIINQTFNDFELIIINDGSTDLSEQIIQKFTDKRIIYIKQDNSGVGLTLKKGCQIAKGKYIARMDSDDISCLNRFEYQYNYLEKHPNIGLVSCGAYLINSHGERVGHSFPYLFNTVLNNKLKYCNPIIHPGVMMRKDIYFKTIGYTDFQPFEDYILWFSITKYTKIRNIAYPLINYRITSESVSSNISNNNLSDIYQQLVKISDLSNIESLKNIAIQKIRKREEDNDIKEHKSYTTFSQAKLFALVTKMGFSELNASWLICFLKSLIFYK